MGIIVTIAVVVGLGYGLVRALRGAPSCVCGREDCGGGCWPRK